MKLFDMDKLVRKEARVAAKLGAQHWRLILALAWACALWAVPAGAAQAAAAVHVAGPTQAEPSIFESVLRLVTDPNVAYLLFVLGLLGLIGEVVTPGTLVPGTLGVIALVLALIGLGHLPTNWAGAMLIVLAVGLFLFDLHVPGHALSVGGVTVFALGSLLLFTPFWVPRSPETAVRLSPWLVAWTTAGVGAFFLLGMAAAWRSRNAPLAVGRETIIGQTGTVSQALSPNGIVHVQGEEWSAITAGGAPVPAGTTVRVIGADGLTLRVEPVADNEQAILGI